MNEKNPLSLKDQLRAVAQKELSLSPLMEGKEKIASDDIVNGAYTMIAFDFITTPDKKTGVDKTYPVILFEELPENFYLGGTLLAKVCTALIAQFGDQEEANVALAEGGGIKFAFSRTHTSSGNNLMKISVVD